MTDPTLQRLLLKAVMSLPAAVLRRMAGAGSVTQGGRTLDPRVQVLAHLAARFPPIQALGLAGARKVEADARVLLGGDSEHGVRAWPLSIEGSGGPLGLRAYRHPSQDPASPLLVFAHGGGGVLGDLETGDSLCRTLARRARCAVLSVDYRLAPEHPCPAGLDDVMAAYRWGRQQAARFGAAEGAVAIGGDSMGANFAAVIAQQLKRLGEPAPALQLLIYPAVDMAGDYPSAATYADAYPLTAAALAWFLGLYLPPGADPAQLQCSPIREPELTGLAPAVIITAGFDPLLDQGEAYAGRLRAAGVPVSLRGYDALPHGFAAFTGVVPAARAACREIGDLVRAAFEGRVGV